MTTTTLAPLTMPEIKTAPTDYDRFKANRSAFADALVTRYKGKQITGLVQDHENFCFVGAAQDFMTKAR